VSEGLHRSALDVPLDESPGTGFRLRPARALHSLERLWTSNRPLGLLLIGLVVMFSPTAFRLLAGGAWTEPENSHGPLILAIALYLLWERWPAVPAAAAQPDPLAGWTCLLIASLLYVPGRALHLAYLEAAAFVWAMLAVVLLVGGIGLVKRLAFPLLFLCFMVPMPTFIAGQVSGILKPAVSAAAVGVLRMLDYPVARSGAIISIGPYELLVADACAGMSTLFMLEILGILYLHLVRHGSWLRNVALPILIVPISFIANTARVVALALITYYFGDEAGQGFMHGFAGLLLFVAGLSLMFAADSLLRFLGRKR